MELWSEGEAELPKEDAAGVTDALLMWKAPTGQPPVQPVGTFKQWLPQSTWPVGQASESLTHANLAGEHITGLGGHPPLNIKDIKETFKHDIDEILKETLAHEQEAIRVYYELLELVQDNSVYLEEYARSMIGQEELHVLEVEKMLKNN